MTIETFKPLAHKWKIERIFQSGTHPTRIQKTCTVCTVSGGKSRLEGVAPCPGKPHSADCMSQLDYMMVGNFFQCDCGRNKGHRDKLPEKVEVCIHCARPRPGTSLTRCAKSVNGWHTFRMRKNHDEEMTMSKNKGVPTTTLCMCTSCKKPGYYQVDMRNVEFSHEKGLSFESKNLFGMPCKFCGNKLPPLAPQVTLSGKLIQKGRPS